MKDIINKAFGTKICFKACIICAAYRLYFKPPVNFYIDTDRVGVSLRCENSVNKQKQH